MTTKTTIKCQDNSHWHVKVTIEDRVWDVDKKAMSDDWRVADSFTLSNGEEREVYIHDSRRLMVTEIIPDVPRE